MVARLCTCTSSGEVSLGCLVQVQVQCEWQGSGQSKGRERCQCASVLFEGAPGRNSWTLDAHHCPLFLRLPPSVFLPFNDHSFCASLYKPFEELSFLQK